MGRCFVDRVTVVDVVEASYKGNIGMMEVFKFYEMATPEQKAQLKTLMKLKQTSAAWELIQSVTGVKLHTAGLMPPASPSPIPTIRG